MDTTTMQQNTLVEHIRLSRTATPAKVVNPHSTLTRMFLLPTVTSAHHKKQENDPSQQDKADPPKCATLIPYAVRSHLPHMRASDMFGTGNFCGGSWERSVWESRLRHKPGTKSVYASPPDVILVQHSDPARLAEELSALLCVGPHPGIVSCLACVSATTLVLERAPLGSLAALAPHLANECTLLHTNCMLLQVCAALTKITKAGWVLRNISWQHVLLFVFDPQSPRECVVKLSNFSAAVRGGASQHRNRTIGWQKGYSLLVFIVARGLLSMSISCMVSHDICNMFANETFEVSYSVGCPKYHNHRVLFNCTLSATIADRHQISVAYSNCLSIELP
eukprot:m.919201 g.919201  ORF g.919201 m.919201 type:complete len:336 (+) comp23749_c0_seq16:535-1542(+)